MNYLSSRFSGVSRLGGSAIAALLLSLASCNEVTTGSPTSPDPEPTAASESAENSAGTAAPDGTTDYQAAATTTYTWQVEYTPGGVSADRPSDHRLEQFETASVTSVNGVRPEAAASGPDEKGLWWPALPPEPTVDQLEAQARGDERASRPEILKSVDYAITFNQAGETVTLPTDYDVYRQAVKAYERSRPLKLTLGPQDESVIKAEIL